MARYQAGEIHFNLMAIVQDKLVRYKEQMLASVNTFLNEPRNLNYIQSHMFLSQEDPTRHADLKLLTIEEEERRKTWRKVCTYIGT